MTSPLQLIQAGITGELGPVPPAEENRKRLRASLSTPASQEENKPRARSRKSAQVVVGPMQDSISLSPEATALAREFDAVPVSRIKLEVSSSISLQFDARVWHNHQAGTAAICTSSDNFQLEPKMDGHIYRMEVDGVSLMCLFLGLKLNLGPDVSIIPIKVATEGGAAS